MSIRLTTVFSFEAEWSWASEVEARKPWMIDALSFSLTGSLSSLGFKDKDLNGGCDIYEIRRLQCHFPWGQWLVLCCPSDHLIIVMWHNIESAPWDNLIRGDLKCKYMPYGSLSFAISLSVLKAYVSSKKRVVKVLVRNVYCIHCQTLRKLLDFYPDSERQKWKNEIQSNTHSVLFSCFLSNPDSSEYPVHEIKSLSFHLLSSCVSSFMFVS